MPLRTVIKDGILEIRMDTEISIRGIISPANWDADFNVTEIKISADQERDFLIELDSVGEILFKYIQESVKVSGVIGEDGKGNKTITVKNFEVLD